MDGFVGYSNYAEYLDLIPTLLPGAEGKDSSITHSAIAPGSVTTTKEKMDLSKINRDTANVLNTLGQIFDKKTVEENKNLRDLSLKMETNSSIQ